MLIDTFLPKDPSVKRHIFKTFTWRAVGTIDTIIIAWAVTGEPIIGFKVGGVEVLTKMVLYFIHERVWFKINFGLPHRQEAKNKLNKNKDAY